MSDKRFIYCIETCDKLYNCFLKQNTSFDTSFDIQKTENCKNNIKNCLEVCELHFKSQEQKEKNIEVIKV